MDIAKDLRPRTDQHAVANLWVTVAVFFTCAAQRDRLQNRYPVTDNGRFAHHQAGGVIEHDAVSKTGGGVNIDTELSRHLALQEQGQWLSVVCPQPVADAVNLQRLKALEVQKRDVQLVAG